MTQHVFTVTWTHCNVLLDDCHLNLKLVDNPFCLIGKGSTSGGRKIIETFLLIKVIVEIIETFVLIKVIIKS
jgi:hypothetical protein